MTKQSLAFFMLTFYFTENYTTETQKLKYQTIETQLTMMMIFQRITFLTLFGVLPIINAHQAMPTAFVRHRIAKGDRLPGHLQALTRGLTFGRLNHGITSKKSVVLEPPPTTVSVRTEEPTAAPAAAAAAWSAENVQACAKLWQLSPEETAKLQKLQIQLAGVHDTKNNPFDVVRFLKEYPSNEDLVETKFRAMINWRRTEHVDKMLEEYHPPSLYRYFPAGVLKGVDHDGDPIHVERTGAADSIGLLNRYGREEMIKQAIWLREVQSRGRWQEDYEQEHGHPVRQFTVIMDMKGLSSRQIGPSLLSVGQEVGRIVQDYYPGFPKRIIIIRAPAIFQIAFKAFKPFIEEGMRQRITILSGKNFDSVLEKYMDLKVLPTELYPGGQGEAVDEFDTVWTGGKIPTHEEQQVVEAPPKTISVLSTSAPESISESRALRISKGHTRHRGTPWGQRQLQRLRAAFWSSEENVCGWGYPYAI